MFQLMRLQNCRRIIKYYLMTNVNLFYDDIIEIANQI